MRIRGVSTWLSAIGVLMMIMALVVPGSAAAQAGGTKQIINGQTITWGEEWSLEQDVSFVDQEIELVALNRAQSIVGYGATSFAVPGNMLRDVLLEGFTSEASLQQVDRGNYDNVSYSLDISHGAGFTLALFTLVIESANSTTMAVLIGDVTQFQGDMEAAQASVAINGTPIFNGVDAAVMQQHLNDATGIPPESDPGTTQAPPTETPLPPTPEPVTPTQEPVSTQPAESAGTGTLIGDLNSGLGGQQPASGQEGDEQPAVASGAPANSVVLQQSGVEIGYTDDWAIDTEDASRIQFGSTGTVWVIASFLDLSGPGPIGSAMELASFLLDTPDLTAPEIVEAQDLDNGRKLIVLVDRDPVGDIYMIYDIVPGSTATTAFLVVVDVASVDPAVDLVHATLQIDGEPVLQDIREIAPAIFTTGA